MIANGKREGPREGACAEDLLRPRTAGPFPAGCRLFTAIGKYNIGEGCGSYNRKAAGGSVSMDFCMPYPLRSRAALPVS